MGGTQVLMWNIPFRRNPFFTGREPIFIQIEHLLHAGKTAALSQPPALSGLGGIGKTQTAVEYAYRSRHAYQYILWAQANTQETLLSDFVALAKPLNLPEKEAQEQPIIVQAVKRWLETHAGWLLIFDNADDLAMVRDYLPEGNQGHTLLTTRTQAMGGLARKIELDIMEPEEGAEFLLRRAGIIAQEAPFDEASITERALAINIVRAMDGLPLALDQAGAYIEETSESLFNYLTLYRTQRTHLLKHRGGLIPNHPDSVATTWSLAFANIERVNPAAIELMHFCAFLAPDGIPEELIKQWDITLDEAEALLNNAGFYLQNRGQYQEAEPLLQDALAIGETRYGRDHPDTTYLLNNLALLYHEQGKHEQAQPLYQRALAIDEKVLGPEHPDTADTLNNLAILYDEQGKHEQAQPLYQRTLAIYEKVLGP